MSVAARSHGLNDVRRLGYSLDSQAVAQAQLQPYIQQAIDQINFVIGDPSTSSAGTLDSARTP